MRRFKTLTLAACIVSLGGCGTMGLKNQTASPYDSLPTVNSMTEAHHFGRQLVGYYGKGFEKANGQRRLFNVGIWAATTYTTGAAGLSAHADNIFLGALTGTSLGALEPLVNEGGPEAWVNALGKTACLSRAAMTGIDADTLRAIALIEKRVADDVATDKERRALAVYKGVYMSVSNGYDTVYSEFLTRRTGRAISATALADFVTQAQTAADGARQAAAPPPPPAPEAVAVQATENALQNIKTTADAIDGTGVLFSVLNSREEPLLVNSAGRSVTLREALSDPSGDVAIPDSDKSALVNLAPGGAEAARSSALDVLVATIRRDAQTISAARAQAQAAQAQAAANAANADARDAAVRLEAMNTAAAQQIDTCLKTA
ncbi:MAG: hypothetical protein ACK4OJ_13860 [Brevundimonas sp.]